MKEKNPFKIVIASILIAAFFNFAFIGLSSLVSGGIIYNGANYILMVNGTNFSNEEIQKMNLDESNVPFVARRAINIQEYLDALFGKEIDASAPTAGLYTLWTTGILARQLGEVFIMSLIEGCVIGFIVAFLFVRRPKGFELLQGYISIIILSVLLICISGLFINSVSCPYKNIKDIGFLQLLPNLDMIVISIIMISICFLFLLCARNIIDNMNKKLARKKIFKNDDEDIF